MYAGHLRSVREYILQSFDEVHVEQWKINKICTFRTYQSKQDVTDCGLRSEYNGCIDQKALIKFEFGPV